MLHIEIISAGEILNVQGRNYFRNPEGIWFEIPVTNTPEDSEFLEQQYQLHYTQGASNGN